MKERTARDVEAEATAVRAQFHEDALIGRPVEEARRWCQGRGFAVLVEQEGGASVMSRCISRVRLMVRDGIVVRARLG